MGKLVLRTYWRSSCSFRIRIALGYKKLAYEPVFVNLLAGEQASESNKTQNPIGHVPTLEIDGEPFVESVAIMELLDELHPDPPLLPADPKARAHVRALVETVNAGIQPLQNLAVLDRVGGKDQEKRTAWTKPWIERGFTALETLMNRASATRDDGPYAFGRAFTMADCCLVPQVYAARRFGVDLTRFPRIARAEAAAAELPFVAAAKPEAQPDAKT